MFELTNTVRQKIIPRRQIMKRFIISVLCVTVFCIGLGALVEKAGAQVVEVSPRRETLEDLFLRQAL